ncbi:nucleotide-binding domain-containing protein [Cadophora sp. DSE1049]|nr:nucleotide-binding domain-containing protein [Cadophora sp. DSE1049]
MDLKSCSLQLGHNLTVDSKPHLSSTPSSARVLVIGDGVTGLITAWVLLDRGHHVTIVSKEWASYGKDQRLTSQIAGALWEYPPAVCGQHTNTESLLRSKKWCMTAYRIWEAIAAYPELAKDAGVQMKRFDFFFPNKVEDTPKQLLELCEINGSGVRGVRRDPGLVNAMGVEASFGAVDAYELLVPVIDTDVCMKWLVDLLQRKGGKLVTETIHGDLFAQEGTFLARFNADAIVNATGLASKDLASDPTCYPLRGALLCFINDGKHFPKIPAAISSFLVPRNDNILIVGGIAQREKWDLDLKVDSPVIQRMRARCEAFLPCLKNARLDPEYPLAQGLRPGREKNIRVERELRKHGRDQSRIVYSYGHGGSGWSLSFGDITCRETGLNELLCVATKTTHADASIQTYQ